MSSSRLVHESVAEVRPLDGVVRPHGASEPDDRCPFGEDANDVGVSLISAE